MLCGMLSFVEFGLAMNAHCKSLGAVQVGAQSNILGDYAELDELVDEFMPFHTLWDAAIEYKHSEASHSAVWKTSVGIGQLLLHHRS
eukprot:5781283-Amphidinium_carterae.1